MDIVEIHFGFQADKQMKVKTHFGICPTDKL
jgi:hypothetical protein